MKKKIWKERRYSFLTLVKSSLFPTLIEMKAWALLGLGNAKEVEIWEDPATMDLVFKYR